MVLDVMNKQGSPDEARVIWGITHNSFRPLLIEISIHVQTLIASRSIKGRSSLLIALSVTKSTEEPSSSSNKN